MHPAVAAERCVIFLVRKVCCCRVLGNEITISEFCFFNEILGAEWNQQYVLIGFTYREKVPFTISH